MPLTVQNMDAIAPMTRNVTWSEDSWMKPRTTAPMPKKNMKANRPPIAIRNVRSRLISAGNFREVGERGVSALA